jgi:hypothetical protein
MSKQDVMDYVFETPYNTNPKILDQILDDLIDKTGAMHLVGKATANIVDGSTADPVIAGYDFTKVAKGDVVLSADDHKEFVWTGAKWELLGDEGSYVLNTTKINNKPLSGNITLTAADVGAATAADITAEISKLNAANIGYTGKIADKNVSTVKAALDTLAVGNYLDMTDDFTASGATNVEQWATR